MKKIKVGIVGYGNLGKGVVQAVAKNDDMELVAVFTRRDVASFTEDLPFYHLSTIKDFQDKVHVMILCGGSATDLDEQTPLVASMFNTVDSYDTHANIPDFFDKVHAVASEAGYVSLISTGWDPGLFSLQRLLNECILPEGKEYTFWGKGVSQGHSDALRRIEGVIDARQYTVPIDAALEKVRTGTNPELATREKHERICYVVTEEGADKEKIKKTIVEMPNYFVDYDTTVNFIDAAELERDHYGMPHGGFVIRTGKTGADSKQRMEFNLQLDSNPEFTASVLVAYARAVVRLKVAGFKGACTVFDIPFALLSPKDPAELRKRLL